MWVTDPQHLVSADLTLNGEYLASTNADVTDVVVRNGYNYEKMARRSTITTNLTDTCGPKSCKTD